MLVAVVDLIAQDLAKATAASARVGGILLFDVVAELAQPFAPGLI